MEQTNLLGRFTLIGIVTALLLLAFFGWNVKLGQDLRGGTTLRFSLDIKRAQLEDPEADPKDLVANTIKVIRDRIDKHGLAEVVLTPLGEDKFEIVLPEGAGGNVESIRDVVTALGKLEFRIVVRPTSQYGRWKDDGSVAPRLRDPSTYPWKGTQAKFEEYKQDEVDAFKLARDQGVPYEPTHELYEIVRRIGTDGAEVADFAVLERRQVKGYDFDGRILKNPRTGRDERRKPAVYYDVRTDFQNVFEKWTGENVGLPMAIVLNEELRTAPVINSALSDSVQITLGSGSDKELEKEAEEISTVLQTGSLKVRPKLESVNKVGARLAGESKERGILAVLVAFGLVLVFMVVFYRMQGIVANVALLLNVVLLVGTLAFFQAVLTLPGIAGIVLTLGMAVDANILICERIREERRAGRTLRRAVSEGYDRALTTIVDANVTSLITAVFLYQFGSGPVRGFAITLAIGLVVSMFTAIFVTRTINEWLLKQGLFTEISMLGKGIPPKISWVGLRRYFAPISAAGVVFGLFMFAGEDKYTLYDVDFTGGFKLQARFEEPTSVDEVKLTLRGEARPVVVVTEEFAEEGEASGKRVAVRHELIAGPYPTAEVVAVGGTGEGVEITVQRGLVQDDVPEKDRLSLEVQSGAFQEYVRVVLQERLRPAWMVNPPREFKAADEADDEQKTADGGMLFTVHLVDPDDVITPERLRKGLADDMPFWKWDGSTRKRAQASELDRTVIVRPVESESAMLKTFDVWMKSQTSAGGAVVEKNPEELMETLSDFLGGKGFKSSLENQGVALIKRDRVGISEPFPSVDVIGSQVAQRLKNDALIALALSLIGIILYIALRFSSRAMGFAAVLCLFHDVAITLGIVAVANMAGIVDAKINLPMVAAFLTLVGYSVNDTVVVFDRIRENRGKKRVITPGMIDLSINQTLARTIKTSVTFLLACVALFAINVGQRNVLEGFAFLLIVGSIIGTYSTVAIAAPLLLYLPWLWEKVKDMRPRTSMVTYAATHPLTVLFTPLVAILWLAWGAVFIALVFAAGLVMFPVWALGEKVAVEPIPAT